MNQKYLMDFLGFVDLCLTAGQLDCINGDIELI